MSIYWCVYKALQGLTKCLMIKDTIYIANFNDVPIEIKYDTR